MGKYVTPWNMKITEEVRNRIKKMFMVRGMNSSEIATELYVEDGIDLAPYTIQKSCISDRRRIVELSIFEEYDIDKIVELLTIENNFDRDEKTQENIKKYVEYIINVFKQKVARLSKQMSCEKIIEKMGVKGNNAVEKIEKVIEQEMKLQEKGKIKMNESQYTHEDMANDLINQLKAGRDVNVIEKRIKYYKEKLNIDILNSELETTLTLKELINEKKNEECQR